KQSTEDTQIDQVSLSAPLWIDRDTPGAKPGGDNGAYLLSDPKNPNTPAIASHQTLGRLAQARLDAQNIQNATVAQLEEAGRALKADLKAAGTTRLSPYYPFEIVCEELCGQGHATMRGVLIIV